jgi:hypothetical protein
MSAYGYRMLLLQAHLAASAAGSERPSSSSVAPDFTSTPRCCRLFVGTIMRLTASWVRSCYERCKS